MLAELATRYPAEDQMVPDLDRIHNWDELAILWVNSPHNPTGAVAPLEWLERAAELCRRHGVILRPLGDVIAIVPPLAIDAGRLRRIVEAIAIELDAIDAPPAATDTGAVDPAGDA